MQHPDYLEISAVDRGASRLVIVSGDLDFGSVDELQAVCRAPPEPEELVLDLSGVEFIDVVGLRGLVDLSSGEGKTVLISPSGIVRRLILLAGLGDAFVFGESMEPCGV